MSEVIFTKLSFSISLRQLTDRPSYDQLLHLKKPDGSSLRVIRWISSLEQWQCTDLAHMLLKDDDLVRRYQVTGGMGEDRHVSAHSPDCIVRVWRSCIGELVSKLKVHKFKI